MTHETGARRGLIVGKFRPPHRGHSYLIETASKAVDHLVVVVCEDASDTISAALRASWLRELHPGVEVRVERTTGLDPDDSRLWADLAQRWLGYVPDVVFTSEAYGDAWAAALGCAHVCVDLHRQTVPISGSQVLRDPLASWPYLAPPARAYFCRRVVVLGAESTGTTTLARDLAAHYRTAWVPEYGRTYSEGKQPSGTGWTADEFVAIARGQQALEDRLARCANKLLVCDTDALATTVWQERYMGFVSPEVQTLADGRTYRLYVLTGDEIPFCQDGTRDGEHLRHWMHQRFEEVLAHRETPHTVVRGTRKERLADAVAAIESQAAHVGDRCAKS